MYVDGYVIQIQNSSLNPSGILFNTSLLVHVIFEKWLFNIEFVCKLVVQPCLNSGFIMKLFGKVVSIIFVEFSEQAREIFKATLVDEGVYCKLLG